MKTFPAILLVFFIVLLQGTFFSFLKIHGVSANLILVALIYVSLVSSRRTAFGAAIAAGLLTDFFSSFVFGIYTLSFIAIAELFNLARFHLFARTNIFVILAGTLSGTIIFDILVVSLNKLAAGAGLQNAVFSFNFANFFLEALYNLAVVLIIFVFARLFKMLRRR